MFIDIDECEIKSIVCPVRKTCVNFPGTYFCLCAPGFFGKDEDCRKGQVVFSCFCYHHFVRNFSHIHSALSFPLGVFHLHYVVLSSTFLITQ